MKINLAIYTVHLIILESQKEWKRQEIHVEFW